MVPLGALAQHRADAGPSVISLYNLFPSAAINGAANEGFSSGQALQTSWKTSRTNACRPA